MAAELCKMTEYKSVRAGPASASDAGPSREAGGAHAGLSARARRRRGGWVGRSARCSVRVMNRAHLTPRARVSPGRGRSIGAGVHGNAARAERVLGGRPYKRALHTRRFYRIKRRSTTPRDTVCAMPRVHVQHIWRRPSKFLHLGELICTA
jgi:hypothetical protein